MRTPAGQFQGKDAITDKFVGIYVNHWTLDDGERGRESIRRFLNLAQQHGFISHKHDLEFVT